MGSSYELYRRMYETIAALVDVKHVRHLTNLIWISVGMLRSKSIALSKIANAIPGDSDAESRVTEIRRWLTTPNINIWRLYEPIVKHMLQGWQAQAVTLILDGSMVYGERLQIFRLSLVHGNRAIALSWRVLASPGVTTPQRLSRMLRRAARWLRPYVGSVTILVDRGFRDCDWPKFFEKTGWNHVVRVAHNTIVTWPDGHACRIDELGVQPGQQRFWNHVLLTREHLWPTNLSVTWTTGDERNLPEILAVISNQPAHPAHLRHYARRMDIEASFHDDKLGGFDMDHTRLIDSLRLERLLLPLALASLWCHQIGEMVLVSDHLRRIIDPGPQRELSVFQLGLRWMDRCLDTNLKALPPFLARLHPIRLSPAKKRPILN